MRYAGLDKSQTKYERHPVPRVESNERIPNQWRVERCVNFPDS